MASLRMRSSDSPINLLDWRMKITVADRGTGILSQLRAKLRDRAVRPVRAGCYFWAALSLTDSKTRYNT